MKEVEIPDADSIQEGEMKEVQVGADKKDKVLVARYEGKLYSVGAFCTHFGAPLNMGMLIDDKVLCPWHAAGFSIKTGAVEYNPGYDGLPSYQVFQRDGKWVVQVPEKLEQK
jgi:nitrite reductase/ring-hydroxylating ferredoxin subunit